MAVCYASYMPKPRGRSHTTLTETAELVVKTLYKLPNIKMIAPGHITTGARQSSKRFVTVVYTTAGFELIISGQSTQKVAVHTTGKVSTVIRQLKSDKALRDFHFKVRSRKPGI